MYVDQAGDTWPADRAYGQGGWGYGGGIARWSSNAVSGTEDDDLYRAYRESPGSYRFDVDNGDYAVTLRFAEFVVNKASSRRMRITIEGQEVESQLSIYGEVGRYAALDRSYTATVGDGQLTIELAKNGGRKDPVISAISVVELGGGGPTPTPSPTATPVSTLEPTSTPPPTLTPTPAATTEPTLTPMPTATPIPSATPSPTSMPSPTASPTPTQTGGNEMHVGDLDGSSFWTGNRWKGSVTIEVHEANEGALANTTVSLSWSGGSSGSGSCTTDGAGRCTVTTRKISGSQSSVTFSVDGLSRSGWSYAASANHDPDNDSDGTTITVYRP
jgi:hypothetical protein